MMNTTFGSSKSKNRMANGNKEKKISYINKKPYKSSYVEVLYIIFILSMKRSTPKKHIHMQSVK